MSLVIFASPKGGVGKTTLTANVAAALHRQGRPVLLLDLDPQNALRLHFGLPVQDMTGFMAQRLGRGDWRAYLRRAAHGMLLLPHGAVDLRAALELAMALEREPGLLTGPLREMLSEPGLVVLADLPPGPSQMLQVVAPLASAIVTVLQSEAISATMLAEVESGRFLGSGTLATLFAGRLHYVLNGVDLQSRLSRISAETVARHLGTRLLGAISRDEAVGEALANQLLVQDMAPASAAAADLRQVAQALSSVLPTAHAHPPAPALAASPPFQPLAATMRGAW